MAFFNKAIPRAVGFIRVIQKRSSRDEKHILEQMATVCSTAVANSSKVPSSRQILSMRWILHLLNSSL